MLRHNCTVDFLFKDPLCRFADSRLISAAIGKEPECLELILER